VGRDAGKEPASRPIIATIDKREVGGVSAVNVLFGKICNKQVDFISILFSPDWMTETDGCLKAGQPNRDADKHTSLNAFIQRL
jgi:hypothetical protein